MKNKIKNFHWPEWPLFFKEEQKKIKEVLKTNTLFNGKETKQLEQEFSKYNRSKYVKVVGNATTNTESKAGFESMTGPLYCASVSFEILVCKPIGA